MCSSSRSRAISGFRTDPSKKVSSTVLLARRGLVLANLANSDLTVARSSKWLGALSTTNEMKTGLVDSRAQAGVLTTRMSLSSPTMYR